MFYTMELRLIPLNKSPSTLVTDVSDLWCLKKPLTAGFEPLIQPILLQSVRCCCSKSLKPKANVIPYF